MQRRPERAFAALTPAVALVCVSVLVACDDLFVGPGPVGPEVALSLSVSEAAGAFPAPAPLNRVRVVLLRPDGAHRDTIVALEQLQDGVRARLRLQPPELIRDLKVATTLYSDLAPLLYGTVTLDASAGTPVTATVPLGAFADRLVPGRTRLFLAGPGDTAQLTGRAFFVTGDEIVGATFGWASDNPGIVTVDANGFAKAIAAGSTTIWMSHSGRRVAVAVEVLDTSGPHILPLIGSMVPGESLVFTAHLGGGSAPPDVRWRVAPGTEGVLVVTQDGSVLALAPGASTLVAEFAGDTLRRPIDVTIAPTRELQPLTFAYNGLSVGDLAGNRTGIAGGPHYQPTRTPDRAHIATRTSNELRVFDLEGTSTTLALGGIVPSWPEYSMDGQWIYFEGLLEDVGARSVYRVRPDGSGLAAVSPTGARHPTVAPDGNRIAYVQGADLVVQELGGFPVVVAAGVSPVSPSWSPTGEWIAYVASGAYLVRPDGTGSTRLGTIRPGEGLTWSPDGKWLLGYAGNKAVLVHVPTQEAFVLSMSPTGGGSAVAWVR